MDEKIRENFITEFPKEGFSIVEELQGRMHFAILDQIKMMQASGMQKEQIKETLLANVEEILLNYDEKQDSQK